MYLNLHMALEQMRQKVENTESDIGPRVSQHTTLSTKSQNPETGNQKPDIRIIQNWRELQEFIQWINHKLCFTVFPSFDYVLAITTASKIWDYKRAMSYYFRVFRENVKVMVMWNSLLTKLLLHHTWWFWAKATLIRQFKTGIFVLRQVKKNEENELIKF